MKGVPAFADRPKHAFLATAAIVAVLDQLVKLWVVAVLPQTMLPETVIPGFCRILHIRNPGGAWGIFANFPGVLTMLSVVVAGFLVLRFEELTEGRCLPALGLGLALGGILGNLVDRLFRDGVIDYIQFSIGRFPLTNAINIADAAITLGVLLFMVTMMRQPQCQQPPSEP